jgi:hypothetical protein
MIKTIGRMIGAILLWAAISQAEWSTPVRISEPGGCQYPQILAQGDTLHVVFMHSVRGRGLGYVRSTDSGLTWSQEIELSDVINTNAPGYPRIMVWGQNLLVVWHIYFNIGYSLQNIGYSISHNNGISWSAPRYLLSSNWDIIGQVSAANNDSIINVIFSPDTIFYNVRSTNFGATWAAPQEMFRVAHSLKPDQAAKGELVHFSWPGRYHPNDMWEVYYIKSTNAGQTWLTNMPISDTDNYISNRPAIAVNETGDPAISWWDFKYSPYQTTGDILARWSYDQGANWTSESQVTQNHLANISDNCWTKDTIRVVWMDMRFGGASPTIYYTYSFDSTGVWSSEERLEDDPAPSKYPAITACNGNVYVVWYDARCAPDTDLCGGIYFTRNPAIPDAITEPDIPDKIGTLWAYPNPFNSSTIISYSNLMEGGEISIYNLMGQKVRAFTIENGKEGKIIWDAEDASGKKVSSGLYFAKAVASQKTYTIKLLYLR